MKSLAPEALDALVSTYRPAAATDKNIAVLYLHGGGLLYGRRDDLPAPYVQAFTEAGYTLLCADYPLAPECPLPKMVEVLWALWERAVAEPLRAGTYAGHFLFGRSAGAYLALILARELKRRSTAMAQTGANGRTALPQPLGILDFYGFPGLDDPAFLEPARAYTQLPEVTRETVAGMLRPEPITAGPKPQRYGLYAYARQHRGAWLELLGLDNSSHANQASTWSLSEKDIACLPPLFITASTGDEDVPFRLSKALARQASDAVMKTVYYLPHDFDRDVTNPIGIRTYAEALAWMDAQL